MLVWIAVSVLAASVAWKYRGPLMGMAEPRPEPKPFVFDNGSSRKPDAASAPVARSGPQPMAPGVLRKCVRGNEAPTYTNVSCPPGYKEKAVDGSRVTVVPGGSPQAAAAQTGSSGSQQALRGALDLGKDDRLRDRMMERAIEAGSK